LPTALDQLRVQRLGQHAPRALRRLLHARRAQLRAQARRLGLVPLRRRVGRVRLGGLVEPLALRRHLLRLLRRQRAGEALGEEGRAGRAQQLAEARVRDEHGGVLDGGGAQCREYGVPGAVCCSELW
jgi:hypothetical protein